MHADGEITRLVDRTVGHANLAARHLDADLRRPYTDEFVVVTEGRIVVEVGSERVDCRPGDLVRIPAGTRHTLRTAPERGSVWFYGYGRFEDES